jgi:hypothetical protein
MASRTKIRKLLLFSCKNLLMCRPAAIPIMYNRTMAKYIYGSLSAN